MPPIALENHRPYCEDTAGKLELAAAYLFLVGSVVTVELRLRGCLDHLSNCVDHGLRFVVGHVVSAVFDVNKFSPAGETSQFFFLLIDFLVGYTPLGRQIGHLLTLPSDEHDERNIVERILLSMAGDIEFGKF